MNNNKSLSIIDNKICLNNCFVKISGVKCQSCKKTFKCKADLDAHWDNCHQPMQQTTRLVIKIGTEIISETDLKNKYLKRSLTGDNKENVDDPVKKRRRSDSSNSKNESNIIKTSMKICENIQEYLKLQENLVEGRSETQTISRDDCDIEINGQEIQHSTCITPPVDESTEDLLEIEEHKEIIPVLECSVISISEISTNHHSDDRLTSDSSRNEISDAASNQPSEMNGLVPEISDASHVSFSREKDIALTCTRLIREEETEEINIVDNDVTLIKEAQNSVIQNDTDHSPDANHHLEFKKSPNPNAEREKSEYSEDSSDKEKDQNGEEEFLTVEQHVEIEEPRDQKPSMEELRTLLSESNQGSAEPGNSFYAANHVVMTITRDEKDDYLVVVEDDNSPVFVLEDEVSQICEESPENDGESVKKSLDQNAVEKVPEREDSSPNSTGKATVGRKNSVNCDKSDLDRKQEERSKRVRVNNTRSRASEEDNPKSQNVLHEKAFPTKRRGTKLETKSLKCKNGGTELTVKQKQFVSNAGVPPRPAVDETTVSDKTANSARVTAEPEALVALVQDKRPSSGKKSRNKKRRKTQSEKLSDKTKDNKINPKQRKEDEPHEETSIKDAKCNDMKENVKLKGANCLAKSDTVLIQDGRSIKVPSRRKRPEKSERAKLKNKKINKTELTLKQKLFFSSIGILPEFTVDQTDVDSKNTNSSNVTTESEALVVLVEDKSHTSGNRSKTTEERKSAQHSQKFSSETVSIRSHSEQKQREPISEDKCHDRVSIEGVKCNYTKENMTLKGTKCSSARRRKAGKVAGNRKRSYSKRDYSKEKRTTATSPNYSEKKFIKEV